MIIHVVQQGDTIQSIAAYYGVSETVLIQDNGLINANRLVIGQTIVIVFPELTYTVKEGDNLYDIAVAHGVTVMQLLQNNPYLADRDYLFPGDILVISYEKIGTIATHGIAFPYVKKRILRKTLPYLTYLSVVNYTISDNGDITSYYDDSEFIQIAKGYHVVPLMFLTTLTLQGESNYGVAYDLLLSEESQDRLTENALRILREKGFFGINISFEFINYTNLPYIEHAYTRIASKIKAEGFLVFATINPNIIVTGEEVVFERIDYTALGNLADNIIFMNYEWAVTVNPPSPISSINNMRLYLSYINNVIPSYKLGIGLSTIGYDWELPFIAGISSVRSLTYDSAISLASNEGAIIQFDEVSQTPFFNYTTGGMYHTEHIVWFIDARSIEALLELVLEYDLNGTGIWTITVYNTQLWLIINSQFDIMKYFIE